MRKLYLFIMAALLLIGSGTLWAANTGTAKIDDGDAQPIYDAISAWKTSGGTLTLLEDCNYETPSATSLSGSYGSRKEWTLNLNDQHLTWNVTSGGTRAVNALTVGMYGSLTINGGDSNTGKITFNGSNTEKNFNGLNPYSHNQAITKINGGTFEAYNDLTTGNVNVLLIANSTSYNNPDSGISDEAKFENHVTSTAGKVIKSGQYKVKPDAACLANGYILEKDGDYYKVVEGSYVVSINGEGYTGNNVEKIWEDYAGQNIEVEVLKSGNEFEFNIPATFTGLVTLKVQSNVRIVNSGNLNFDNTTNTKNTYGNLNLTNNGTVTMGACDTNFRVFSNNSSIVNNGTLVVNYGNKFNSCTVSGNGLVELHENCTVPFAFKNLANVTIPENCVWAYSSSTEYIIVPNTGLKVTVNGVYYSTVAAAMDASSEEYPATLQADCSELDLGTFAKNVYLDMNGFNLQFNSGFKQTKGSLNIENSKTAGGKITCSSTSNIAAIEVRGAKNNTDETTVNIGANVTIEKAGTEGAVIGVYGYSTDTSKAYGVTVNVRGNLTGSQCVTINGEVTDLNTYPEINIYDGAVLTGTNCANSACIYAAGYGRWNIYAANLNAATPIYAKSGVININGATIEACGEYAEAQPYGGGFYSTGDAIVFDSKNGYAGSMSLTITDATISSANGYAVQEVLTDREESQTLSMVIAGGKYNGSKGTIVVSEQFGESTPEHWADNSIMSGKYTSAPSKVADGYVVALNTDSDKDVYPYTVVEDNVYPSVVTEITENTSIEEAVQIEASTGIVVKSPYTYSVKGIIFMGDNARIIVEPGATLIVGENGFVGSDNNSKLVVLQADKTNGTAKLLFNGTPDELSHPYARVEQYMYARSIAGGNLWQHIGVPTQAKPDKISKTDPYMFNTWSASTGWQYSGQAGVTSAWTGYNVATNRASEGSMLTYEGKLEGASATQFALEADGYSCFANSYTAPMSIEGLINSIPQGVSDNMVWIYQASDYDGGKLGFKQYILSTIILEDNDPGIASMQAFFLKNNTSDVVNLNAVDYSSAVLGFTPKAADATELNGGFIYLSGDGQQARLQIIEKEDLSDEWDENYDGGQMETDFIKIYIEQEGKKLSAIGTNRLEGKEITIETKGATSYQLSFAKLKGNAFRLTDIVSGAEIEVSEENTYNFTADANSTIKRFILSEGVVSAEETKSASVKVWSADATMYVEGNEAEAEIEIFNLSGVKVAAAKASGEAVQSVSIGNLASGVYVVRVGDNSAKIVK